MNDDERVQFLERALPRLRMRWSGFRRVRRQVGKRIERRVRELDLDGYPAYEDYLDAHPDEWPRLDAMCRVTISRFYRDRAMGDHLRDRLLPALGGLARERGETELRCWSAGCGAGEEPYTVSLIWHHAASASYPDLELRVLGTDADAALLERAETAVYKASSLRDLPDDIRPSAFDPNRDDFVLRAEFLTGVEFRRMDVRRQRPEGTFHLVLCRNLVFTYYDEALQRELLPPIAEVVVPGGALVVGAHERLPAEQTHFTPWGSVPGVYRRVAA